MMPGKGPSAVRYRILPPKGERHIVGARSMQTSFFNPAWPRKHCPDGTCLPPAKAPWGFMKAEVTVSPGRRLLILNSTVDGEWTTWTMVQVE